MMFHSDNLYPSDLKLIIQYISFGFQQRGGCEVSVCHVRCCHEGCVEGPTADVRILVVEGTAWGMRHIQGRNLKGHEHDNNIYKSEEQ